MMDKRKKKWLLDFLNKSCFEKGILRYEKSISIYSGMNHQALIPRYQGKVKHFGLLIPLELWESRGLFPRRSNRKRSRKMEDDGETGAMEETMRHFCRDSVDDDDDDAFTQTTATISAIQDDRELSASDTEYRDQRRGTKCQRESRRAPASSRWWTSRTAPPNPNRLDRRSRQSPRSQDHAL